MLNDPWYFVVARVDDDVAVCGGVEFGVFFLCRVKFALYSKKSKESDKRFYNSYSTERWFIYQTNVMAQLFHVP